MKTIVLTTCMMTSAFCLHAADPANITSASDGPQSFTGKVLETTNAASYTYVFVDTGKAKNWAAAPQFPVKVGDTVSVQEGMPMPNYHSKTMNRDFDVVYFTGKVLVAGRHENNSPAAAQNTTLPPGHPPIGNSVKMDFSDVKPVKNGKTVAEINDDRTKLAGKPVTVRGKVVKYNAQIMGKNWLHIRDGSGGAENNDLAITTSTEAKVGDIVLVSGRVGIDRDFGANYKYSVIIEDAEVVVEH